MARGMNYMFLWLYYIHTDAQKPDLVDQKEP